MPTYISIFKHLDTFPFIYLAYLLAHISEGNRNGQWFISKSTWTLRKNILCRKCTSNIIRLTTTILYEGMKAMNERTDQFKVKQLYFLLSDWWTHLAGQTSLVEGLVCWNELGVTQQRNRQLGCYSDLKTAERRKNSGF